MNQLCRTFKVCHDLRVEESIFFGQLCFYGKHKNFRGNCIYQPGSLGYQFIIFR